MKANRKEDNLAAQNRDPLAPLEQSFCQSISLSSFMMLLIKPSISMNVDELNVSRRNKSFVTFTLILRSIQHGVSETRKDFQHL